MQTPINYKAIFQDLLTLKYPERLSEFQEILKKNTFNELDVLEISKKLSSSIETNSENGKYRSYSKSTILKILEYQKKNQLNNAQLASHFGLSRNTVTKWKNLFF